MDSLIGKSFEYLIVETKKIYNQTINSGYSIDDLRKQFNQYIMKELNQYNGNVLYNEETEKIKQREFQKSIWKKFETYKKWVCDKQMWVCYLNTNQCGVVCGNGKSVYIKVCGIGNISSL